MLGREVWAKVRWQLWLIDVGNGSRSHLWSFYPLVHFAICHRVSLGVVDSSIRYGLSFYFFSGKIASSFLIGKAPINLGSELIYIEPGPNSVTSKLIEKSDS